MNLSGIHSQIATNAKCQEFCSLSQPDGLTLIDRRLPVPEDFDLRATIAPTAWSRGRWPNADWIDGEYIWTGRDAGAIHVRRVKQTETTHLHIRSSADLNADQRWLVNVMGVSGPLPTFTDARVEQLRTQIPGLYQSSSGSLFEGLIDCIVGQSITVAAAATVQRRLYALFDAGIEIGERHFYPAPTPDQIAESSVELVRSVGVTWKRAEAIVAAGKAYCHGALPTDDVARHEPDLARTALRALPLVGKWTCESALLWGIGTIDAFPSGDVALLRAVRQRYDAPEIHLKELDRISETWAPARGYASRLFWTDLLGKAPEFTELRKNETVTRQVPQRQ